MIFKLPVAGIVVPFVDLVNRINLYTDAEVNEAIFIIKDLYKGENDGSREAVNKIIAALIEYRNN
jgi:hypothetical protein